ncbi:hypothetical protein ACF3OC_10875 [Sphingobacterium cellulitidis]|uniref:hypothetical protein n=1 Tax=Sphingobacterium cellulitidis TaxID=1768011 RepID=UPI00370DC85F
MKSNIFILFILASFFTFQSCSKDDPTPEVDQEEVGSATLTFTEVEAEKHDDHYHYHDISNPEVESVEFSGEKFLPPVGAHIHLEVGKSYRFNLKVKDFAGRESQQTFIDRADQHFAFLLGAPAGTLSAEYADKTADGKAANVGVTGYITVIKASNSFTFRYLLRHLNPGVKSTINPKTDIFNADFNKFGGANDLDLKVELHLVEAGHEGH